MSPTNNDTGLREKIANEVKAYARHMMAPGATPFDAADRILALPEIAEALRFVEGSPGFAHVELDADTGINTGPGSGNTPEDQRRDVGGS